ncbi:hypothetical protein IC620_04135 [Hazenella sp. IB182357]|uniref:Uncharacterized protein n=1 Tax=Polycladospora coralii TaxID=2771432 RepID=A0A926NDF5_9BACL|nr:hypothetical protein [Polycladospora coralii]MBD1371544.1 hypothetical protein [Polycladospora coralii]
MIKSKRGLHIRINQQNLSCTTYRVIVVDINERLYILEVETQQRFVLSESEDKLLRELFSSFIGTEDQNFANANMLLLDICTYQNQIITILRRDHYRLLDAISSVTANRFLSNIPQ